MIWMYAVRKKELRATDVTSLSELHDFSGKVDWLWVDCLSPDEKEAEIISELLGNEKTIVNDIKEGTYNLLYMYTNYEKRHDYTLLSIPFVDLEKELRIHPIFVIIKEKMLITWGCEHSPALIKAVIGTLKDHVNNGMEADTCFILSRLFREIAAKTSKVMLSFRELVDKVEEEALEKVGKKTVHSIFGLKKEISTLHRLLYLQEKLMSDAKEGMIPNVRLDGETKLVVEDTIENICRELEFIDSYDRALDGVLNLLHLGSIHRVETSINFLTIMLVILTIILVVLELAARSHGA